MGARKALNWHLAERRPLGRWLPAFAVNRKYIVSLETSDKQLVEYALNLVTALSNER